MPRGRKATRHGDIRRVRHSDAVIYSAWVLWLIGFTETQIGTRLGIRKKQVAGIILRSDFKNRGAMSYDERQARYEDLVSKRFDEDGNALDEGKLQKLPKEVMEIGGR